MKRSIQFVFALWLLVVPSSAFGEQAKQTVAATIQTTLTTASQQIRQFAFDGDPNTYFLSAKNPTRKDHFTLVFDIPVAVKTIAVTTGKPGDGDELLEKGDLEISEDGKKFIKLVKFTDGVARAKLEEKKLLAIRIKSAVDMMHPLAIREFTIESDPVVAVFKYPVEFVVDVNDAPELKDWANKVARVCERQYPMICEELKSDGFKPLTVISMRLSSSYNGVAAAGGASITGSVKYFKGHHNDIGAMVHETVHCVQQYRGFGNPGWLVEGIADYLRFFKYEPGKLRELTPEQAKYNGSYRTTAAFLAFVTEKHDKDIVRKLNADMRAGTYKEKVWKDLTGKTVEELGQEWRASLAK